MLRLPFKPLMIPLNVTVPLVAVTVLLIPVKLIGRLIAYVFATIRPAVDELALLFKLIVPVLPKLVLKALRSKEAVLEREGVTLTPTVSTPKPFALVTFRVPLLTVTAPVYKLLLFDIVKVPLPVFVIEPLPVI